MPSVELVDGKWVSVSGVRATDLDAGKLYLHQKQHQHQLPQQPLKQQKLLLLKKLTLNYGRKSHTA